MSETKPMRDAAAQAPADAHDEQPASGRRGRIVTLVFIAFSFALAFWQRPGWATSDTKIDLHVDPSQFLHQVASVWALTTDLGEVHSAQYSGYLWPMGPFFALLHSLGISAWVVQRMWLGLMFALSAWGMLRLLDVLIGRRRGVAHVVATTFYILNPYTVVFTARTTITLLGYAALPWLILVTIHGARTTAAAAAERRAGPRRRRMSPARLRRGWRPWWWAAAFALILTSTGGGVNAAVVGWMLVGPLVALLYEPAVGLARWRDAGGFLLRVGILGVIASLWWIVPLLVHVQYGIDFLQFTEQPGTIWGTNSASESLRLMGYWTSYIGVGFGVSRPFFSDGPTLLFNPLVVGASLLLPALAIAGYVRARRLTYAPLFLLLIVVGTTIMTGGFPDGTPLRGVMDWTYHNIFVLRFMRTTNKAAPLVAVGVAGLLGLGSAQLLARLRGLSERWVRWASIAVAGAALTALIVLAALPLVRGGAQDTQLAWKRIPAPWVNAGKGLNRTLPANDRAMVLPGQIFAYYNWGGTLDAILPRLTSRPVAVRYETPYSDLHAVDLMTTVDDLVQQGRLVPGELPPLLKLMGVGAIVAGADDDLSRSGAVAPSAAAATLASQGYGHPADSYGHATAVPQARGDIGAPVSLPQVRRYDVGPGRGIVHVDSAGAPTIVDGSAASLADLAAFGALPGTSPAFYAADLSKRALLGASGHGADIVVGDSNRRRLFLPQSTQQNRGATLAADDPLSVSSAVINPFAAAGTDAQTVSVLLGARYLHAPSEPGELQFPEHAPIAAFDGDVNTSWVADRYLPVSDRWIEVGFSHPRDVPYVDLNPLSDAHGVVTAVDVNGVHQAVHAGWNRIVTNLHNVSRLRVTIDNVVQPKALLGGPGGFREIRIPGVHLRQVLRAPIVAGRDLAGRDISHDNLSYVFERTTGDDPFRRNPFGTTTVLDDPLDRGDAETQIDRAVFAPAARRYRLDAWVYPAVTTPDSTLDTLAGYRGPDRFDSSSRFQNQPAYRASGAFARDDRGWIGVWQRPEAPAPWIAWATPRRTSFSTLRLTPSTMAVRRPTVVALSWPGGSLPALNVDASGTVRLPRRVSARSFRLTILQAAFPATASATQRQAASVGIGAVLIPGLARVSVPRTGPLTAPCGTVRVNVGGRVAAMRVLGSVAQLDAGRPLRAVGCGAAGAAGVPMPAGIQFVTTLPAPFSVDLLRLRSPAPAGLPAAGASGSVVNPGKLGDSSVDGVRVALPRASWIVLGESFDAGWRATCDGRSLGAPQVIDGYANGWLAPAGCRHVSFSFAPQSGTVSGYVVSAIACALLLLFLLLGALRGPSRAAVPLADAARRAAAGVARERTTPRSLPRAAALALLVAVPLGFAFALRAGAVSFPLLMFVLWRGYGPRVLTLTAAALLGLVVPIIYAITAPNNRGGFNFVYSTELIWAHWVGVAIIVLCALAAVLTLRSRRR